MSNLKRDIEELVKEEQLAHCCAGMGCETASHIDVQPIINLIESVVDGDKLWAVKAWFVDSCKHKTRTLKDVKLVEYIDYLESKLIGKE